LGDRKIGVFQEGVKKKVGWKGRPGRTKGYSQHLITVKRWQRWGKKRGRGKKGWKKAGGEGGNKKSQKEYFE